jgi:hypothetical protein
MMCFGGDSAILTDSTRDDLMFFYVRGMIIESGYGLHQLMFRDERDKQSSELRIVCLDSTLHPIANQRIADRYRGALDQHTTEIIDQVDREGVKFFAVGHRVADTQPHQDFYHHYDDQQGVVAGLTDQGFVFLGHQVHDSEWWGSSGPMYRFESYALDESVPRVLVIPGPHPFLDCDCAACGPRNARSAAGRAGSLLKARMSAPAATGSP